MTSINSDGFDLLSFSETGSGPVVVLLHGYPFNRTLWVDQVEALSKTHRVITPDLRGHGESSVGPAGMNQMAVDVASLLDARGVERATIGGLSMGGYVTLAFYRQFPERVNALILADTRAQADTEENKRTRAEQIKTVLSQGMKPIVDVMLPKLVHPETVSRRPEAVKRLRDMMIQTRPEGAAAALEGMATRDDQTELLSKISVPTLIIVGKDDPITPLQDSEKMHERITGSRLVVIEKTSHVSNLERPDEFNKALVEFLSDVGA
jgi:3-oxoadipate enol-lactonase